MSKTTNKYSPEVRERAVRMVLDGTWQHESRWAVQCHYRRCGYEIVFQLQRVSQLKHRDV
jgi:hypothetical protein